MAVNLQMKRGDTFVFTVTVAQAGAAYNLTGSTMRMTAKWNYTDADNQAVFTCTSPSNGIVLTTPASGIATVTVAPSKTSSLPANPVFLYYDIQVTDGSGNVYTVVDGILTVNPDVSITTP